MKKPPPTKRQLVDKLKAKFYNQQRNLMVKQFKEMAEFHEEWACSHPDKNGNTSRLDHIHSS